MIRNNKSDAPHSIDSSYSSSSSTSLATASSVSSAGSAQSQPASPAPAAVIGPKIRFKGELVGEEDLLVQGQIDGTIDLRNNTLTVGEQGTVKANVLAKTITIEGSVEGDIYGKERIEIKSSSHVRGNLVADRVTLEDGAKFKGSIDMDIESHKDKFEQGYAPVSSAPAAPAHSQAKNTGNSRDKNTKDKDAGGAS